MRSITGWVHVAACAGALVVAASIPMRAGRQAQAPQPATDADTLYAQREDLQSATRAADLWADRLNRDPRDFEAAWKLARACYWLGSHVAADGRHLQLERGMDAARKAIAIDANRPEGHFWLAADMGTLAEMSGMLTGLRYRKPIREELERVLAIDPAFQQGSADRALGRWYFRVPGLFGGSKQKSEEHLRRALTYNPNSTVSHYFLAETLLAMDRNGEARAELQKVIDAPLDPNWIPEDREWKQKARDLLRDVTK